MTRTELKNLRQQITSMYLLGSVPKDIAARISCTVSQVYEALDRAKLSPYKTKQKLRDKAGLRICRGQCKTRKPLTDFNKSPNHKLGRATICKECFSTYQAEYREKRYAWDISHRYNISAEQYQNLLTTQNGCCAICKDKPQRRLSVDHCHTTDTVRALLCHSCNVVLGLVKESPERLEACAQYLRQHAS